MVNQISEVHCTYDISINTVLVFFVKHEYLFRMVAHEIGKDVPLSVKADKLLIGIFHFRLIQSI